MSINGFSYRRGVWEIHVKNRETVMINSVNVNISTTTEDLEENNNAVAITSSSNLIPILSGIMIILVIFHRQISIMLRFAQFTMDVEYDTLIQLSRYFLHSLALRQLLPDLIVFAINYANQIRINNNKKTILFTIIQVMRNL